MCLNSSPSIHHQPKSLAVEFYISTLIKKYEEKILQFNNHITALSEEIRLRGLVADDTFHRRAEMTNLRLQVEMTKEQLPQLEEVIEDLKAIL